MAEVTRLPMPGQGAAPMAPPGLNLPVPAQGLPDMPLLELAAEVGAPGPDMSRASALIGQMMQLAAELATVDPVFVQPADQFARSIIPRLGFATQQRSMPRLPAGLPPLPPLMTTP